jgi:hypothetical protein
MYLPTLFIPLCGFASIASALPATDPDQSIAEIIPSPRLPSLESLNITSRQLFEMGLPKNCMFFSMHQNTADKINTFSNELKKHTASRYFRAFVWSR